MGKLHRKLRITVLVVVVLAGVVGLLAWLELRTNPAEPIYEGKPLSYWLRHPQKPETLHVPGSYVSYFPPIDTNAIPFLIKSLNASEGPFYRVYATAWPRLPSWLQNRTTPPVGAFHERASAANLLGNFGTDAAPAVPALVKVLREDSSFVVRIQAAYALGRIGCNDKFVLDALATAKKDPMVAQAAEGARKALTQ